MEESKSLDHRDEIPDKNVNNEALEVINKEPELIENTDFELSFIFAPTKFFFDKFSTVAIILKA